MIWSVHRSICTSCREISVPVHSFRTNSFTTKSHHEHFLPSLLCCCPLDLPELSYSRNYIAEFCCLSRNIVPSLLLTLFCLDFVRTPAPFDQLRSRTHPSQHRNETSRWSLASKCHPILTCAASSFDGHSHNASHHIIHISTERSARAPITHSTAASLR
jgi:hypothetical protein